MADTTPETGSWYSEETSTFGDRIVGAREAAGMSQSQLARRLGVRLKTLTDWENDGYGNEEWSKSDGAEQPDGERPSGEAEVYGLPPN